MSEMKHTPGPWICDGEEFVYALNDLGINRTYVLVQGGYTNKSLRARTQPEELKANAKLIAAAPDMLDALKSAIELSDRTVTSAGRTEECQAVHDKVKAAIAKAEGRA